MVLDKEDSSDDASENFVLQGYKPEANSRKKMTTAGSSTLSHPCTESEAEWSDMFPSDDEEEPQQSFTKISKEERCKDAALSAALISTIERLAISAALSMSRKPRTRSQAKTIMNQAIICSDPKISVQSYEYYKKAAIEDWDGYHSSFSSSESDSAEDVVCMVVRKALCHNSGRNESLFPIVITEELLREVDRIAVRAALTMTDATHRID